MAPNFYQMRPNHVYIQSCFASVSLAVCLSAEMQGMLQFSAYTTQNYYQCETMY